MNESKDRNSKMWQTAKWAAGVGLLLTGGMVYTLFRPRTLLLFRVLDGLGWTERIELWREAVQGGTLPEWMVYNLPAGLWATAYILIADAIHCKSQTGKRLCIAGFIPLLGIVAEVLQGCGWLRGTFDWADMAAYTLPFAIYYIIIIIKNKQIWN